MNTKYKLRPVSGGCRNILAVAHSVLYTVSSPPIELTQIVPFIALSRRPLRDDVRREILDRILSAELAPGARLRDTSLARDLGVSRTPVREALLRLERDGHLVADMGRGFTVRALDASEVEESYPIIAALECEAMRLAPISSRTLGALESLNSEMAQADNEPEHRLSLDLRWHCLLTEGCRNVRLLSLLESLRDVVRRYELAHVRELGVGTTSTRDHRRIAQAIAGEDPQAAATILLSHWRAAAESITARLAQSRA
ncbi:MAG: GntR family transcriptional regulator [Gemmatimonadaceae bacterium]